MIRLIFEVALARGDDGERAGRLGRGAALLAADRAFDIDADEIVVAGAIDAHVEGVVLFLIDERVGAGGRAEHMRLDPLAEQGRRVLRSEQHTSDLQSLMRTSYAVFCLNKEHNVEDN